MIFFAVGIIVGLLLAIFFVIYNLEAKTILNDVKNIKDGGAKIFSNKKRSAFETIFEKGKKEKRDIYLDEL